MSKPADTPPTIALYEKPGHLIRWAQQIAVLKFHDIQGRHARQNATAGAGSLIF